MLDVRPLLAEILHEYPDQFEVVDHPDEFGSGFRGLLKVLEARPDLEKRALVATRAMDELILAQPLLKWSDDAIVRDLASYRDVDPNDAKRARDLLK